MFKIRDILIDSEVVIAPMAGITNSVYRKILRQYMNGLICCEMVSDKGINYRNTRTLDMLNIQEEEGLISLQVFGGDVESIVEAAKYLDQFTNCNIIDINMGCPVKKVLKTGGGANLLKDPLKIREIVSKVVKSVSKPVTVKIRMGYDSSSLNYLTIGKIIEEAGASAITLHARTRAQLYSGNAQIEAIKLLKESINIPVIGNGDITCLEDAIRMKAITNCDAIMIGRGILGNPWLAQQIEHYFQTQEILPLPTYEERIDQAIGHLNLLVKEYGEKLGVVQMRSFGAWYLKGIPGNAHVRLCLNKAESLQEMRNIFIKYRDKISLNN
ncbi:MAG: tRNA dihydrouridine synthase DusB [Bacilli bacterium]|nr:tRNA dihydrouridine synthase DusB [Bacilli bacterium]